MCEAVGIKGIAKNMGLDFSITLSTDSSAAKGIATRMGLEKVKRLETRTLWAQDKIDEGMVVIKKIGGDRNVAEILTKYLSSPRLRSLSQSQSWRGGTHWRHSCRENRNVEFLMICSHGLSPQRLRICAWRPLPERPRPRMCRNLKPKLERGCSDGVLPKALHAMTCKWWYSPNGHVAKVSGQSECKSHSLVSVGSVLFCSGSFVRVSGSCVSLAVD